MHFIDFKLLEWPSGQSTKDLINIIDKNLKVEYFKGEEATSSFHQVSSQEIPSTSDETRNTIFKILKYNRNQ